MPTRRVPGPIDIRHRIAVLAEQDSAARTHGDVVDVVADLLAARDEERADRVRLGIEFPDCAIALARMAFGIDARLRIDESRTCRRDGRCLRAGSCAIRLAPRPAEKDRSLKPASRKSRAAPRPDPHPDSRYPPSRCDGNRRPTESGDPRWCDRRHAPPAGGRRLRSSPRRLSNPSAGSDRNRNDTDDLR